MTEASRRNAEISAGALAGGGAVMAAREGASQNWPGLANAYIARDISFHNALRSPSFA